MIDDEHPPLVVNQLTKRFGKTTVVDSLSFTVASGSITGFVGGNGAGKSTTMRMILGLTKPTEGSVLLDGKELSEHPEPRNVVGAQLERVGAHPGITGRRHLMLVAAATGVPTSRVDSLLKEVDLADAGDQKVGKYSTGMTRRLALGAALLTNAPLLILDEPSNGLDPAGIRWLRTTLQEQADEGTAVLVSTHQLAELGAIVDHLVVLDEGRLVASGPVDELLQSASVHSIEDLLLTGGER